MNNRSRIYASVQQMENNLKSGLTVMEVAEAAGFSYYYYNRLFKAITGLSPSTYLIQRRLSVSIEDLMTTDRKIIDIALDYGYSSPEAYARAFGRRFAQTPSDVRAHGLTKAGKVLPPLSEHTNGSQVQQPYRQPELVRLDAIQLAGIPFFYDLSQKNDLTQQWLHLLDTLDQIKDLRLPHAFYQMQLWFPDQAPDTLYFFIAAAVNGTSPLPIQLTAKTIPAQDYLRFYHKGLSNQVGDTYRFIYEEWLPRTDYSLPYHFSFEYYGPEHLGPYNPESVSEIYIPVVRP